VEESEQLQMTMSVSIVILKDIGHVIVRIDEILQGEVEEDHFQDQDLIQSKLDLLINFFLFFKKKKPIKKPIKNK